MAGRVAFRLSLAATIAVWLAMSLWSMPRLSAAGGGPIFDLRFLGYDAAGAAGLLEALGSEGRAFYLAWQQGLDWLFPGLLGLTLVLWYHRTAGRGPARVLSAVALLAMILDYAENVAVRRMLLSGTAEGVEWASLLTQAKSAAGALALGAAGVLLLFSAVRLVRGGR
jgi:uncharacterized membrane protein (UPF0136 family)